MHVNGAKLPAPNQTLIANEANQPSGVAAVELHRTFNLWQYSAQADGCRSPPDSGHHAELCMHAFAESHAVILPFSPGRGAAFLLGSVNWSFWPEWKENVAVGSLFCAVRPRLLPAEFMRSFTSECFTENPTSESRCNSNQVYINGGVFYLV